MGVHPTEYEDGLNEGDYIDPEEYAYTEAFKAVSYIYPGLEYEEFVVKLDEAFKPN